MSLDPDVIRTLYKNGNMRPTGEWIICASVGCESPAAHDVVHRADDGQVKYVPLCEPHIEGCPTDGVEYETLDHGFMGGPYNRGSGDGAT